MLYKLLKIPVSIAICFYCRHIRICHKQLLNSKGPLLLAANHPNSFLDAVILATLFKQPIYSLARGDVFSNKWSAALLKSLNILPVYRDREGSENLQKNYGTFHSCLRIFQQQGIVLIFSEALCENEWHLRPLKKGTARLAAIAWQHGVPLRILPVGINYSSFTLFGKNVHLNLGTYIDAPSHIKSQGTLLNDVTTAIRLQLQELVYEIDANNKQELARVFTVKIPTIAKVLLAPFAAIGYLLHLPLYFLVKNILAKKFLGTSHYDSVLIGLLFLLYPAFLLLIALSGWSSSGNAIWLTSLLLLPFTAWSYMLVKKQTDISNVKKEKSNGISK